MPLSEETFNMYANPEMANAFEIPVMRSVIRSLCLASASLANIVRNHRFLGVR